MKAESRGHNKLLKHELVQFNYPLSYLCLAGFVVTSWSFFFQDLFLHVFFFKILEDISPFCGATGTPVLDFC